MSTFWEDVLALGPTVAWMGRELSGTNIADDSGGSRPGTLTGAVATLGQASLIPNQSGEPSINLDGTDVFVIRTDETALDVASNKFTALVSVKPTDLAAQRDIIGKVDSWQIWLQTSGVITGYFTPPWTALNSSATTAGKLVAGGKALIVILQDGPNTKIQLWICHEGDGSATKVAEATKSNNLTNSAGNLRMGGSSTAGGRSFKGDIQGFAYWRDTALTAAQIGALSTKWDTVEVPTTPDAPSITNPTNGETFSNSMFVTVEDGADTGEFGALEYYVEYQIDSGGWNMLIDWTATRPVDYGINVSAWAESANVQLRAYMRRSVGTVSDASSTIVVEIAHSADVIHKPIVSWLGGGGFSYPGGFASSYIQASEPITEDPSPVTGSEWEVAVYGTSFAAPITYNRVGVLLSTLYTGDTSGGSWLSAQAPVYDTDYEVRMRYSDDYGNVSSWSDSVRIKTPYQAVGLMTLGQPMLARDESGYDNHCSYWFSDSSAGVPTAVGFCFPMSRFPFHKMMKRTTPDYGVVHDHRGLVGSNTLNLPANAGVWPPFRMRLRGYLQEERIYSGGGFGIMGYIANGKNTGFQVWQKNSENAKLYWYSNGIGIYAYLDFGDRIEIGEFDWEIEWDGSGIYLNDALIASRAPVTLSWPIDQLQIGHHSRVGPALAGALDMLIGILTEFEFDWNGINVVHLNFADPDIPTKPVLIETP